MAITLTDHQIELLQIIDCVRWAEVNKLGPIEMHLVRRALGADDWIVAFELEMAVKHEKAYLRRPPTSPPPGPKRSPWMIEYLDPLDERWFKLSTGEGMWEPIDFDAMEAEEERKLAERSEAVN